MSIRVGIVGYGNLGGGVEMSVKQNADIELVAIFTRRDNVEQNATVPIVNISKVEDYKEKIDVMILCGGSATDLPVQGPELSRMFNTVDSFDTHAKIPEYFAKVDESAKSGNNLSLISSGWDPGLFSLNRVLASSILPNGIDYTFWGTGVSQGHSDAIRRIEGVVDAKQYTVPVDKALEEVRSGSNPNLSTRDKHNRVCYVVVEEGADKAKIEEEIVTMPNYFFDYNTTVNFISADELKANHSGIPHGGFVIRTGTTGDNTKQKIEFNLELGSNPEFTSSVLVACSRAVYRMASEGKTGAISVFDIPFGLLSSKTAEELRKDYL